MDFWQSESTWPDDPAGYVFLGRVVDQIGKAFEPEWTGREFAEVERSRLEGRRSATPLSFPEQSTAELAALRERLNTPENRERIEKLRANLEAAKNRIHRVRRKIAQLCEAGSLRTAGRPVNGGGLTPIDADWWRTEHLEARFTRCQLNPSEPFHYAIGGDRFWYIFAEKDSLDEILHREPEKPEEEEEAESPDGAGKPHDATRRSWHWAKEADVKAEFTAYIADGPEVKDAVTEQHLIEARLQKRIGQKAFRQIRQEVSGANLGPGPRPPDYRHSLRK
jgi:hypothetical protein